MEKRYHIGLDDSHGAKYAIFEVVPHGRMTEEKSVRSFRELLQFLNQYAQKNTIVFLVEDFRYYH